MFFVRGFYRILKDDRQSASFSFMVYCAVKIVQI